MIEIRALEAKEAAVAASLACAVFNEMVAPELEPEGIAEFHRFARSLGERLGEGNLVFVGETESTIVGVVELRDASHISMLFVDANFHGSGVGRALLERALRHCEGVAGAGAQFTVHSSLGAESFYRRLGFERTGPEQLSNGIRFIPMATQTCGDDVA